jgi:dipeptidyl aminopeptidase/acylaminoacyl peptidase
VRRVLAGAALVVAGALGAATARGYRRGVATTTPDRHPIPAAARAEAFQQVPDLRDATLHTSDGLALRGWFSPGRSGAAVVLVHGGGNDRTQMFPVGRILARHGYGFLVYDSRASGESDGDITTSGDRERRDVTAALDFVTTQPGVDPRRVALLGHSVGGTSVALVAASDPRVRAAILCPVWTSLEDETKYKSGRLGPLTWGSMLFAMRHTGIDVDTVRPIDHIGEVSPRALLFITGTADHDTPVATMRRMYDAAGEPKEMWIVDGSDHGKYLDTAPAEYEARVVAFLDRSLGQPR